MEATSGAACSLAEPLETGVVLAPAGLSEPNWADLEPSCPATPEVLYQSEESATGVDYVLAAPLPPATSSTACPLASRTSDEKLLPAVPILTGALDLTELSETVEDLAPLPASFNASLATLSEPNWADGELNWALYEPYWSPGASGATLASGPALSGALYFQAEILLEAMAPPANLRGRSKREWQQMRATACLAAEALEPVSDPPLPTGVTIDLSSPGLTLRDRCRRDPASIRDADAWHTAPVRSRGSATAAEIAFTTP